MCIVTAPKNAIVIYMFICCKSYIPFLNSSKVFGAHVIYNSRPWSVFLGVCFKAGSPLRAPPWFDPSAVCLGAEWHRLIDGADRTFVPTENLSQFWTCFSFFEVMQLDRFYKLPTSPENVY